MARSCPLRCATQSPRAPADESHRPPAAHTSLTLGCQQPHQRRRPPPPPVSAARRRTREKSAGVNTSSPSSCAGAVRPKKRRKANRACAWVSQSNRTLTRKRRRLARSSRSSRLVVQAKGSACSSIQVSISFTWVISQLRKASTRSSNRLSASSNTKNALVSRASANASAMLCSVPPT